MGTHPFMKTNVKPETLEIVMLTSIGSTAFKENLVSKYGVDNAMKVAEIAKRSGMNQSKTKKTDEWLNTVEPERLAKYKISMLALTDSGETKLEVSAKRTGVANKKHQDQRVSDGLHQYSNGFYAVCKDGSTTKISTDIYNKNKIGHVEDWEFVHPTSTEAKRRKLNRGK